MKKAIDLSYGIPLALLIARLMPLGAGRRLAQWVGERMAASQRSEMVQAVRINQWVVSGGSLDAAALQRITRAVFRVRGRCLFDHYHHLNDRQATLALVDFDPAFEECIERSRHGRQGQLLAVPHFSNYDLAGRAAGLRRLRMQVLSYPNPNAGYSLDNRLRSQEGLEITPITMSSLRMAIERLREGGTVLTGVDRPVGEITYRPTFFGRPAALPLGYIRLALSAGVPIVVISGLPQADGRYCIWASHPIQMVKYTDREKEALRNAEAVLEVIEHLIRQGPENWSMFYPLWPEARQEMEWSGL